MKLDGGTTAFLKFLDEKMQARTVYVNKISYLSIAGLTNNTVYVLVTCK